MQASLPLPARWETPCGISSAWVASGSPAPSALAGYMQRDLVEERRWISEQDYVEGRVFALLSRRPNDAMGSNKFPLS
jgi:hypothetical protein